MKRDTGYLTTLFLCGDVLVDGMVPNASFVPTEDRKAQPRKSLLSQKTTCVVRRNLLGRVHKSSESH